MSKSSGSGFASFKRAVSGGNKVGNDEKSSGEFQTIFFLHIHHIAITIFI